MGARGALRPASSAVSAAAAAPARPHWGRKRKAQGLLLELEHDLGLSNVFLSGGAKGTLLKAGEPAGTAITGVLGAKGLSFALQNTQIEARAAEPVAAPL